MKDIRKEYVKAAADRAEKDVRASVGTIVSEVLESGAVVGDGYSKTTVKPLRELIRGEVVAFTTKKVGDGYGRGGQETALQQMVRVEVAKALKGDLATVLEEQRVIFKAAVQAAAAQQIADAAARRV